MCWSGEGGGLDCCFVIGEYGCIRVEKRGGCLDGCRK